MDRKFRIIMVAAFIILCGGTIINITKDPLLWGTAGVTLLFMLLLFGIDPMSPAE